MFNHCGQNFKPKDIWFLANNKECYNRILYIGFCPKCQKNIVRLVETERNKEKDANGKLKPDKIHYKTKQGKKAIKEIELCASDMLYTAQDIKIKKGKPYGWIYGKNKEIRNSKGKIVKIKQIACDFFGQKEIRNIEQNF